MNRQGMPWDDDQKRHKDIVYNLMAFARSLNMLVQNTFGRNFLHNFQCFAFLLRYEPICLLVEAVDGHFVAIYTASFNKVFDKIESSKENTEQYID